MPLAKAIYLGQRWERGERVLGAGGQREDPASEAVAAEPRGGARVLHPQTGPHLPPSGLR